MAEKESLPLKEVGKYKSTEKNSVQKNEKEMLNMG